MLAEEEYSSCISAQRSEKTDTQMKIDVQQKKVKYECKKRKFNEMMEYSSNLELESFEAVKEIYKYYPSKKRKFSDDTDEKIIQNFRDLELLNQLQRDMNNLKLNNYWNKNQNCTNNYSILDENVDISDIPEISDIPCRKLNISIDSFYVVDQEDIETTTGSSNLSNLENDIPFISHEEKITGKLIDNALKTEKTLMKYFDNLNPSLQPNNCNALVLYQDMEKIKTKIDTGIIVNYLVNELNEHQKKTKEINSDAEMDFSDILSNNTQMENLDFEYLVNNTYDDNYCNMYLD